MHFKIPVTITILTNFKGYFVNERSADSVAFKTLLLSEFQKHPK